MTDTVTIYGNVERVTYHNTENGFCVLRVKVSNKRDLVTVVGNIVQILSGEDIEAHGVWIKDKNFGVQLKAHSLKSSAPNSADGIKKYLASGLIKGIGKHFASVLVNHFSGGVFDILDNDINRLLTVPGIGAKRLEQISKAWVEQKAIREVMVFLYNHKIGTNKAVRIYKTYGEKTIQQLQTNPYQLSIDVWGIGFKTADALAMSLGIDKNSLIRAEAGVRHAVSEYSELGNSSILPNELIQIASKLLEIDETTISSAIANEITNQNLIQETIDGIEYLSLSPLYYAEVGIANNIKRLINAGIGGIECGAAYILNFIDNSKESSITLSPTQKQAVINSSVSKFSVITGGPGVGKTTIVKTILQVMQHFKKRIILCAPTGRAAKRLKETTGFEAHTIHRLLEYRPGNKTKYNQDFPLTVDFIVIDETSMVDIIIMNNLLKAIPTHAMVLLVGDINQLPSVGVGNVLSDIIESNAVPVSFLTEIFRQAATSKIVTNAHKVNQGSLPYYENKPADDFFMIELQENEAILDRLTAIITTRLPKLYNFDPINDIQVLSPMNRGIIGVHNLNTVLQEKLNPHYAKEDNVNSVTAMGNTFWIADKIIQKVNNYDKKVFNGDIGIITHINSETHEVSIKFDELEVVYEKSELDEIELAYAITIHKSQGSEYPVVIIPVSISHYTMLERNLIYTGITRGKKMVILIGQKKALYMAISKVSAKNRITNLKSRLKN